jgi:hypothetical protein
MERGWPFAWRSRTRARGKSGLLMSAYVELRPIGQRSMSSGTVRNRSEPAWLVVAVVFMDRTGPRPTLERNRRSKGTSWDASGTPELWKKLWKWSRRRAALTQIRILNRNYAERVSDKTH